jgi:hypothetical protein
MLDPARLVGKLREFCDPAYAGFRGYPTTRDQARTEWAAAFADYFAQVQEAIVPPVSGHPTLATASVQQAFHDDLGLDTSISAEAAATDFAGAWRQGVQAVTPGSAVTDGTSVSYVYIAWSNTAALYTPLHDTLEQLFETPSGATVPRLTEIAQAFHVASSGLVATATLTSSGVASPGTFGVL